MLLPVPVEVLPLEDEDVEDDVEEDEEEDDFDDVACDLVLLKVEFVVELVPDMVMFAMLPVPIVEFVLEPVVVELPEAAVELLLETTPLVELEDAVEVGEEAVAEAVEDAEARAATASVGQVEQPPKSWSMPE